MSWTGKDNVQCIRARTLPEVVRMARSEKVVPIRPRLVRMGHRLAVVLQMPRAEKAHVVEMPGPRGEAESGSGGEAARLRDGIRMTLVALFALLGWPRPGHGDDPGAAAARPWKVERLNAISTLRIPAGRMAAQRAAYADEDALARAA